MLWRVARSDILVPAAVRQSPDLCGTMVNRTTVAAWEFQTLQNIAEKHNWHKFVSMQNYYNLLYREEGMSLNFLVGRVHR